MTLLFVGPLWKGSTSRHRLEGFVSIRDLEVKPLDSMERVGSATLADRVRHRLRWPADRTDLNGRFLAAVAQHKPELVFVDATRLLTVQTLRRARQLGVRRIAFYSPDDVSASHNSSRQLEGCDGEWDAFFTTKSFCVPELQARGVRNPVLVGNSYHPPVHRPMAKEEIGSSFERYDAVFVGTYERERQRSLNALAEAGMRVVIYGNGWMPARSHSRITHRNAALEEDYTRALHEGKVALGFLRKLNRDLVTQRSVEVPATGRPMVAEKSPEHDDLFVDGNEYVSFSDDAELVNRVRDLLADEARRNRIAEAGRQRCLKGGYSTADRARTMFSILAEGA